MALSVYAGRSIVGRQEVGGQVLLELPLGRLLAPSAPVVAQDSSSSAGPPAARSARPAARIAVSPSIARACVRAAWRAHGLADLESLDSMRSRARTSALLPEARLRIARDWDQSYRLTPTNDDPYRLQESNGGGRTIEGRFTWRLDRLLFVDEELSMDRLRLQHMRERSRVAGDVLHALFDWQRARMALADPGLDDAAYLEAVVQQAEAAAVLDVLTGGWFSGWLASGGS